MLQELLDSVAELAVQARQPKVLKPAAEPEHVYYLIGPDGHVGQPIAAAPQPRRHTARDLGAIVHFAQDNRGEDNTPEVWYSRERVVVFLCPEERRDQVTLPVVLTRQMQALAHLEKLPKGFSQKDFIRLLRVELNGAVSPNLVGALRRLKVRQLATGEMEVTHGKSSIGKSLEAELSGAAAIPDEVTLTVPVFEGWHGSRYAVTCALEIDPQAEQFFLLPYPGEVERALREAERVIGESLEAMLSECNVTDVPVLYGNP